jgi:hypothetical protein
VTGRSRWFPTAIAAIDAANAADPTTVDVRGRTGPKELLHAELVTEWVGRLTDDPGEDLLLAARGHHLRRWTVPRSTYPPGRAGYLRWRRDLHDRHARELAAILRDAGYDEVAVERVATLVTKRELGRDPETQVLEDALCLVFLETQLGDVAATLDRDKLVGVLAKTLLKMSDAGRHAIDALPLDGVQRSLLADARQAAADTTVSRRRRRDDGRG